MELQQLEPGARYLEWYDGTGIILCVEPSGQSCRGVQERCFDRQVLGAHRKTPNEGVQGDIG